MRNNWFKKGLVIGIIVLFVGASVTPSISGNIRKTSKVSSEEEVIEENLEIGKNNEYSLGTLSNGVVSYWKFDEGSGTTAYDSAGDNDGTIYGATWTTNTPSGEGYALSFDGTGDRVIANPVYLDEHTINLWIYVHGFVNEYKHVLVENSDSPSYKADYAIYIMYSNSQYYPMYFLRFSDDEGLMIYTEGDVLDLNTWYMITVSFDGSTARLYLDASPIAEESFSYNITQSGDHLGIADDDPGRSKGGDLPFDGIIDEVRIYDKALSENEIWDLWCSGPQPLIVEVILQKTYQPYPESDTFYQGELISIKTRVRAADGTIIRSWIPFDTTVTIDSVELTPAYYCLAGAGCVYYIPESISTGWQDLNVDVAISVGTCSATKNIYIASAVDSDGDGLWDFEENWNQDDFIDPICETNPHNPDTDYDDMWDREDPFPYMVAPNRKAFVVGITEYSQVIKDCDFIINLIKLVSGTGDPKFSDLYLPPDPATDMRDFLRSYGFSVHEIIDYWPNTVVRQA